MLGAPIAKALLGKAAVPDEDPLTTGPIGLLGSTASEELMRQCDVLLIVGSSRFGLPVGGMQTAGANLSGWARFLDVARHMAMPTIT